MIPTNSPMEEDDVIPSVEQAALAQASRESEPVPSSTMQPQATKTAVNVDHPYGDGKHDEAGSATLGRLGAGRKYGQ